MNLLSLSAPLTAVAAVCVLAFAPADPAQAGGWQGWSPYYSYSDAPYYRRNCCCRSYGAGYAYGLGSGNGYGYGYGGGYGYGYGGGYGYPAPVYESRIYRGPVYEYQSYAPGYPSRYGWGW